MVKTQRGQPHFYSFNPKLDNENKSAVIFMNLLSWSISRVLSWTIIPSRRQITLPLKQPTRTLDGPSIEFPFGLATSGVYLAARCYQRHGVLLPHPFTLTVFTAVCSLLHWSSAHAARTLSGTLPFVARTFLSFTCPTRVVRTRLRASINQRLSNQLAA